MIRGPVLKIRRGCKSTYLNYRLRNARLKARYRLADLAEKAGVTTAAIASYEMLRAFPTKKVARKIARTLNVSLDFIFPDEMRELGREERLGSKHEKKYLEKNEFCGINLERFERINRRRGLVFFLGQ
jgi:transcriptional regulator with XRE-family HTH domain